MRIKKLVLKDFGPFRTYTIPFVPEEHACVLLTGRNNEGKSNIILALKLVSAATKVLLKRKQAFQVRGDVFWRLLQQDTQGLLIGRMVHNYQDTIGEIHAHFDGDFSVSVYVDPRRDMVYADFDGVKPSDAEAILGFIPPLGPLSEGEDVIKKESYLRACLNTSLAPRHLRNHLVRLLDRDEYKQVCDIINGSWHRLELLDYEINYSQNKIYCYYREDRIEREIAWAGQGLQVWFQIIVHLVRLRAASVLILDEPEINLHPEKQNHLVRIIREHYSGSVIIATHSVELMNNVNVSHIIHVQKRKTRPQIKSAKDRASLDLIRSEIGSNFNLVASQFEDCDVIVFTEDESDFVVLRALAQLFGIHKNAFNIPLHGFSEYKKAPVWKDAYRELIGKDVSYSLVLDRDYYPDSYLAKVREELQSKGIRVFFTPGKEIENLYLSPGMIRNLVPTEMSKEFACFWDGVFKDLRLDCYSSFLTLHKQFLNPRLDTKTVTTKFTPAFEETWANPETRHVLIDGKRALQKLRAFYRDKCREDLTQRVLVKELAKTDTGCVRRLIQQAFCLRKSPKDR